MNYDDDDMPFDMKDLRKLFRAMQEEFNRMLQNDDKDFDDNLRSFIKGFSVSVGPDGPKFKPIDDTDEFFANLPSNALPPEFQPTPTFKHGGWEQPYCEIHFNVEEKKQYQIVADIPGIDDVHIEIDGKNISFQGELGDRKYKKKMKLEHELDPNSVKYAIRNGTLEILVNYTE